MESPVHDTPLELLLIRHGESSYNRDGSGGFDSDLTDVGIEQSRRLAPWLVANFKFVAIYSSPMVRSRRTAEIAAAGLSLPVQFREDLREVDFELGPLLPFFANPVDALTCEPHLHPPKPAAYADFEDRVTKAFCEIIKENNNGTILVFTHGGVIATFLRTVFGAHQVSIYADNTSAVLLRWRNARWYLVYSNRVEHLL
jgi:broad specificity phosphatase PhoE